jgi:hypothetical protein
VFGKHYGIPIQYIEEFCNKGLVCSAHSIPGPSTSSKKRKCNNSYDETYMISPTNFSNLQRNLIVKNKVNLKLQQKFVRKKIKNCAIVKIIHMYLWWSP